MHQVVGRRLRVVDEVDRGVDHLAEVVGRDVGGHADRDPLAAVDEEVGEPGRQDEGLVLFVGVVTAHVDRALVDAVEHLHRQLRQAALGVARGGRGKIGRAVVPVTINQWMA